MYTIYFDGKPVSTTFSGVDFTGAMYAQFHIIAETLGLPLILVCNSTGEIITFENVPELEDMEKRGDI